jgi:hypothetical protein
MKIQLAVPHTLVGRLIATILVILGVAVVAFFFAAILIVAAVGVVVWVLRSALTGKRTQTKIRADAETTEYEVLDQDVPSKNVGGDRLLPGTPTSVSPSREDGSK